MVSRPLISIRKYGYVFIIWFSHSMYAKLQTFGLQFIRDSIQIKIRPRIYEL